jgi:hypothetical protein
MAQHPIHSIPPKLFCSPHTQKKFAGNLKTSIRVKTLLIFMAQVKDN